MEQQQLKSIQNYKKHGISITKVDEETIVIKQDHLMNGYILNQKQLVEIAKRIYTDLHIKPVVFTFEANAITIDWIETKMTLYGIKKNDLVKQLAIDKTTLVAILNGNTKLSKPFCALFYYYFLTYEINADVRSNLDIT